MATDGHGIETCMRAIQAMREELTTAKKTVFDAEKCVVNRYMLLSQVDNLSQHLPPSVEIAATIVAEQDKTRAEIEDSRKEIMTQAKLQADQIIEDARKNARTITDRANEDANDVTTRARNEAMAIIEKATNDANDLAARAQKDAMDCAEAGQAEANRIIEEAKRKGEQLVDRQSILNRVEVECDEMRDKVRQETETLRRNTLEYVDHALSDADHTFTELLSGIRIRRNEIQNRR